MTSTLLMLLLSVIRAQCVSPVPSCPASCVVCSEDAVICHRLAHIIDAPDTTQALLLTEGSISTVQPASLSDLSNITVIGLSHNHISVLGEQSFRNLPSLHTLLLDHNLLTKQGLQGGALTNLTQLQVLALGHNLISMMHGGWLKGSKALRSLKLEGNLLTRLDSDSLPVNDLRGLENLDLSDNLIDHLDGDSFVGLVSLQILDLSRNRLRSAPAEAFSYLSWLTNLNLDLNSWNCSCQLLELAAFLSTFMQQPDKTLYNGRRMVCVSADNPAVTTVLELTEANCVPSNQNITVQIETRGSVTPQLYARDLAITAVICFIGGVGLTLLVVLIYYQVSRRKKLKDRMTQKEEEEGNGAVANHHVNHLDVSEKRRELFLQANSSQPWDREAMTLDVRTNGQFRSRADEHHRHFRCPDCSTEGQRGMGPDSMRANNRTNGGMEAEEERERRRTRMMTEEEKWRVGAPWDIPNKFLSRGNTSSSSHLWKETLSQRPEMPTAYKTNREMVENQRTDVEGKSRGHESLHCERCHRTYRPPEQNMRQGRIHANTRDSALFNGFPSQYRQIDRGRNVNHNQFDMMKNTEWRRETRNVRFDLESSRPPERGNGRGEEGRRGKRKNEARTTRDEEQGNVRRHKAKVQSSRLLKVKLNLNPLRKSKVHPKRKAEQGHSERSSSKKSKDKRQDGKERREKEGKGKAGRTTKSSSEKMKKSTTAKTKDGEEEKEEEKADKGGGEGQKSKTSSKQKKTTSQSEQCSQQSTEGDQGGNSHLENFQPGDSSNTADQSKLPIANVSRQGQHLQGGSVQYQGAGLVVGNTHLSLQHPLSRPVTDRNHTANLSLLGPAGSQLTGSSLSLQGGNFLLNTTAPGSNAMFPSYPANSVAQSIAISGPNVAPSGVPGSFSRQAGVGLPSPATSLFSNSLHANPLQANVRHASPHTSQPAGLASSLAANLGVNPAPVLSLSQNQPPPDSSPLVARLKLDPVPGPGLQTGEGLNQLPPESQAPQDKESLCLPTQEPTSVDGFSGATPQASGSLMPVENLSNNNSQTETGCVPLGSTINISAGVVALTERLPAGLSVGSMQAADVSVSGVSAPSMSTQSVSTTGDAVVAAALVQQEYLSEEGGSSPRRKLKLVLPEKTSSRPPTALERKIR